MSFLQYLGLVVTGAGTLASVLGVFFAIYAKQNGKITRELIIAENRNIQQFISKIFDKIDKRADKRHEEIIKLKS